MKWSFGRKKQRKPPNRSGSGTEALDKMIEAEGSASGNSESSLVVEPARDRSRRRGAPTNTLCLYDAEREATPVKESAGGGRRVMFAEAPRKSSARQLSSLQREESYRLECSNRQPPTRSMSEEGMASYESLQSVGRQGSSRRLNTMHRQDSYRLERCRQLARSMSEEGMSSYQSLTSPIASMNLTRTESYRLERRKPPARSLSDEAMASPQKSLSSSRTDHTDRAFLESSTMSALTMPSVSSFEKPMVYPGFSTLVSHPKRRASIGATPKEVRVGRQTDPEDASCSSLSTAATKRKTRRRNSISTYTLPISPTRSVASMQSEDDDDEARPPMYSVAQYTTAMKPPADYSSSNGSSHHRRGGNRRRKPRKIASFHSSSDSDDSSMLHTGWTDTEEEKPKNKGYTVLSKPLNMSTSSMDSMDMSMLQTGWTDNEEEPSKPRCRQTRRNSTSAFQSSVTSTDSLFATGWTDDENENSLLPPRRGRRRASLATTAPMSRRVTNASYLSPTVYQQPKPNIIKNMSVYDKNTFKSTSPALDKRKKVKKDKMRRRNSTSSSTATSVSSTRRRNSLSSTADTTSMYSETGWIVPPPTSDCEDSIFHETGWSPVKTGRRNSISSTYSDELYPQHALYAN